MFDWSRILPKSLTLRLIVAALLIGGLAWALGAYAALGDWLIKTDEKQPIPHWVAIVQVFLGGIFASIVAAVFVSRVHTKPVWAKDIAAVNTTVQGLATRTTELTELMGTLRTDYETLLERLPDAIGQGFTHSLFSYYPHTSASIADMLSTQTDRIYKRHFDRIIVTKGEDTYKLLELVKRNIDGKPQMLWRVHFRIYWNWLNDSQVTRYPLRDFMILLSAPEDIVKDLRAGSVADQGKEKEAYETLRRRGNYVRSIILNPSARDRRVSPTDVENLFLVESVTITAEGLDDKPITKDSLVSMIEKELPGPLCAGYRMPKHVANFPLATGKEMSFEYCGEMFLRADEVTVSERNGREMRRKAFLGEMAFSPSDVIRDDYSFNLLYPERVHIPGGANATITVEEGSGCRFQDPHKAFIPAASGAGSVPPDFSYEDGDTRAHVAIEKPGDQEYNILIKWRASVNGVGLS